jgi:hypothetical protein
VVGRAPEVVALTALAAALTLGIAAPVLRAPAERVFGEESIGRRHDPYTVMRQFELPSRLGVHSQIVTDLAGTLLARASGPVAAYNGLVLLTFPLAAAAAFMLARYLSLSPVGATVAALGYAFSPFHLAHAAYHPHIAQTQWIPLYLLALWRCLDLATPAAVGWLAAATIAVTLSNFYGGMIAAVITPVAIVAYWIAGRRGRPHPLRRLAITAGSIAVMAVAGVAYVACFAPAVLADRAELAFPRADLFAYGAKWWSYLTPSLLHPLLGAPAHRVWDAAGVGGERLEQQVGIGFGVVALGLVAIARWIARDRQPASLAHVPVLAVVAGTALLCSLSPERTIGPFTFVRPSALLYEVAPMFRAYARFGVVVQLMAVLLAGIGVDRLFRSRGRSVRLAGVALVVLAAGESAVSPARLWRDVLPTSAHRWVVGQPGTWRVLDCVQGSQLLASVDHWLTAGRVSMPRGALADCAESGLSAKLAALDFTHLLVRRGSWESQWLSRREPEGLALRERFDGADLYAITAQPAEVYTEAMTAFYPVERREDLTWRWMGKDAAWKIVNRSGRPILASVDLEVWAFAHARSLLVRLDRREVQSMQVELRRRSFRIGPLELAPGDHELAFLATDSPTVANDLLASGDVRALSFAFGAWQWTHNGVAP